MPPEARRTVRLSPDLIGQVLDLFGTKANAHARLNLYPGVDYTTFAHALGGGVLTPETERRINGRWHAWRQEFLADPAVAALDQDRADRLAGDYYDATFRNPATGRLLAPLPRFTLTSRTTE